MTVQQFLYFPLRDIEIVFPGQTPSSDELNDSFQTLNDVLGNWSHEGLLVPTHTLTTFSLVSGISAYTMGVGGTWNTAALPIKIKGAVASVSGFTGPLQVLEMGDFEKLVSDPRGETAALPYLLGYDNAAPLRNIRVHHTPNNSAAVVEVSYWTPLTQFVALTDTVSFALPAFQQAIRNELALRLAVMFNRPVTQPMLANAQASKAALARLEPGEVSDVPAPGAPQPPQQAS
jgi:hypothetical protein